MVVRSSVTMKQYKESEVDNVTKEEAVREFKTFYAHLYINKVDYWEAQQQWSFFTDSLCREGRITLKQYQSWSTPFPEGKRLKPTRKMLERWCRT